MMRIDAVTAEEAAMGWIDDCEACFFLLPDSGRKRKSGQPELEDGASSGLGQWSSDAFTPMLCTVLLLLTGRRRVLVRRGCRRLPLLQGGRGCLLDRLSVEGATVFLRFLFDPIGEAAPRALATNKPREEPNLDHGTSDSYNTCQRYLHTVESEI